jgi:hypothetical protein
MWTAYREDGVETALRLLDPDVAFIASDGTRFDGHDGVCGASSARSRTRAWRSRHRLLIVRLSAHTTRAGAIEAADAGPG